MSGTVRLADSHGLRAVAFHAIASGGFGYAMQLAAEVASMGAGQG